MSKRRFVEPIFIEGAKLVLRNFAGKQGAFNSEGDRNFGVLIPDELAEKLKVEGWNIKYFKPDENGYSQPWLKVKVTFGNFPPTAWLINEKGKLRLDEENIGMLDWTRITNCDVKIRGYFPSDNPDYRGTYKGITAQLSSIHVTKKDDYLERKYGDIPEIGGDLNE